MTICMDIGFNGRVAVLTVNRPPVNALDETALSEIMSMVDPMEEDGAIGAIVVAGGSFLAEFRNGPK